MSKHMYFCVQRFFVEDNRKKIIDATMELISEKGFNQFTVQDICKKAYIARSTFYYQFHSLEEVLSHCFNSEYVVDNVIVEMIHSFDNPLDKLFYYHINWLNQVFKLGIDYARYRQINRIKGKSASSKRIGFLVTSNFITGFIREAQNFGLIKNPTNSDMLAFTISKTMTVCINQWIAENGSYDLIQDTLETLRTIYLVPEDYSWNHLLKKA